MNVFINLENQIFNEPKLAISTINVNPAHRAPCTILPPLLHPPHKPSIMNKKVPT